MIKFDEIEETVVANFYGGEGELAARMAVDDLNRIMRARLKRGCSIGRHRHETSSEIVFVISGRGKVVCDGVSEELKAGDCHYCKKGSEHEMLNIGDEDFVFYAVVPQQ